MYARQSILTKVLVGCVVLPAVMCYALDEGSLPPVNYYNPSTGQTSPFFPVGWFWWPNVTATIDDIASATGGNTILFSDIGDPSRPVSGVLANLNKAQTYGMKVVIGIERSRLDGVDPNDPATYTGLAEIVNSFKNHPAVLGWVLGDENDIYEFLSTQDVLNSATVVHTLDPHRQVWQVFGPSLGERALPYTTGTNVVATDCYTQYDITPEFGGADEYLDKMLYSVQNAAPSGMSYVNVPQGFGPDTGPLPEFRLPTANEYRWNIYSSLASAGTRGVLNWTFVDDESWYSNPAVYAQFLANTVKPVFNELKTLQPALEKGYNVGTVSVDWNGKSQDYPPYWTLRFDRISQLLIYDEVQRKYFLIVTNNGPNSRTVEVTLSNLPADLNGLNVETLDGEGLTLTDLGSGHYRLTDTLTNHEVEIYTFLTAAAETGARGDLYVARYWAGAVQQFDQTTGVLVPNSNTGSNSFGATGHGDGSVGLLWRPDGTGLLVTSPTGQVVELNGQDGSKVRDFVTTALNNPYDMVWGPTGNTLLVVNRGTGQVEEFNGTTGVWIRNAAAGMDNPLCLVLHPVTGNILVGTKTSGVIKFDYTTGANLGTFASIGRCEGLMVNQAGKVWASDLGSNTVKEFQPDGTLIRSISSAELTGPGPITVRPTNGNLLVANGGTEQILEYSGVTGAFVGAFVSGINTPLHMGFKPLTGLVGTVHLGGYNPPGGDVRDVGVRIELRPSIGPVRTERFLLSSTGRFQINDVAQDTYSIAIKSPGWLQKVISGVVVDGFKDLGVIDLIGGDNDGDNQITSTDLSIVLTNMDAIGE
ncbi:MAG: hypothetical protein WC975_04410 [Phycisphaerae bacterium]